MCSVLFVDIVGYSKKTNAEQIVIKQQFVALWAQAIKDVPPDDIMVVDAGDGAALTALVEPEDTIRVAMALRDATLENNKHNPPIHIRMGINFGPVQLSKDVHGMACIVGDAINIAQRIMSFADAGQITISRSYYDVIKPLAHKYEEMFYYLGQRSDKHERYHHIYGLGKRGQQPATPQVQAEGTALPTADAPPTGKSSGFGVKAALGAVLTLVVGIGLWAVLGNKEPAQTEHTTPQPAPPPAASLAEPSSAILAAAPAQSTKPAPAPVALKTSDLPTAAQQERAQSAIPKKARSTVATASGKVATAKDELHKGSESCVDCSCTDLMTKLSLGIHLNEKERRIMNEKCKK